MDILISISKGKKLSEEEFNKLPASKKAAYIKEFPNSKYAKEAAKKGGSKIDGEQAKKFNEARKDISTKASKEQVGKLKKEVDTAKLEKELKSMKKGDKPNKFVKKAIKATAMIAAGAALAALGPGGATVAVVAGGAYLMDKLGVTDAAIEGLSASKGFEADLIEDMAKFIKGLSDKEIAKMLAQTYK